MSLRETYAAWKVQVENWRWAGVPFYLRAGKRLAKRVTEIAIQFKTPPISLFRQVGVVRQEPNALILRIQPDEGIALKFGAKEPGPTMKVDPVTMDFRYSEFFGASQPEAYERLLMDAMHGDSTLFARRDEVEAAWERVTPLLDVVARQPAARPPELRGRHVGPGRRRRPPRAGRETLAPPVSDVRPFATADDVADAAVFLFVTLAAKAVAERGFFFCSLAGGTTPLSCYRILAAPLISSKVDWERTHVFWGDETVRAGGQQGPQRRGRPRRAPAQGPITFEEHSPGRRRPSRTRRERYEVDLSGTFSVFSRVLRSLPTSLVSI